VPYRLQHGHRVSTLYIFFIGGSWAASSLRSSPTRSACGTVIVAGCAGAIISGALLMTARYIRNDLSLNVEGYSKPEEHRKPRRAQDIPLLQW
jgi:hypothetical protein